TLFEGGIVVSEGAQDHGVAGPGRQQIVDLRPQRVVAAYAATGLQVGPIDARGQRHRLHGLLDNAAECLGHRHGPSSSIRRTRIPWLMLSFSHNETCCATMEEATNACQCQGKSDPNWTLILVLLRYFPALGVRLLSQLGGQPSTFV